MPRLVSGWERLLRTPKFVLPALVLLAILALALAAPLIAPHDPYDQVLTRRLLPPAFLHLPRANPDYLLGTDGLGRDMLSRLIYGARISLLIGGLAMLISGVIGTAIGIAAGYFGGPVDSVLSFVVMTRLAMPIVMVALAVVALVGASLQTVVLVLGFLLWDRFAVVMRSATMQVRGLDYVAAARAIGCTTAQILWRTLLPNVASSLIVVATYEVGQAILLEAAFSFLGFGVQPPLPSWGLMIAEGKRFIFAQPWMTLIPGVAICVLVLAINLLGDGIRDATAPSSSLSLRRSG
jgi:peptide/nickel transport system permease protein